MGNVFEIDRAKKIISNTIEYLQLDLSGLTILTEVGTGLFNYTPIIAQIAGAKKVYAFAKDSSYGTAAEAINACNKKLRHYNLDKEIIEFASNILPDHFISNAQIVTNSGNLRPLDKNKLKLFTPNTVIPLMYEKWELRESDLDVQFCKEKNIEIAGTWENYPSLEIFNYCKNLIIKIVFEAGFEVKSNKIIVWSNDHFGDLAVEGFNQLGAKQVVLVNKASDLYENLNETDFIFFCNYKSEEKLIASKNAIIDTKKIKDKNAGVSIIHLCGDIDNEHLKKEAINVFPDKKGYAVRMTYTLAHLGISPTLLLLTAGLKVGESLSKNEKSRLAQLI